MKNLSWKILFQEQVKFLKSGFWFQFYNASNKDTFFDSSGTPDHSQVELIQLSFFLLGRILFGDLTPCLTILGTLKVSVMTAFPFKEEFSVLKCLKTFKIIFLSPELISFTSHCCSSARYKKTCPLYFIVA